MGIDICVGGRKSKSEIPKLISQCELTWIFTWGTFSKSLLYNNILLFQCCSFKPLKFLTFYLIDSAIHILLPFIFLGTASSSSSESKDKNNTQIVLNYPCHTIHKQCWITPVTQYTNSAELPMSHNIQIVLNYPCHAKIKFEGWNIKNLITMRIQNQKLYKIFNQTQVRNHTKGWLSLLTYIFRLIFDFHF